MRKNFLILLISLLISIVSCKKNNPIPDTGFDRIYSIDNNTKIVFKEEGKDKLIYTTSKNKKHGILFRFNHKIRLVEKQIYSEGILLQMKEYQWGDRNLDSIIFSVFHYPPNEDFAIKEIQAVYPRDSVFFQLKFGLTPQGQKPSYTIELIGNGGIGVMSVGNDSIYSAEYINSNWEKMKRVNNHFVYICNIENSNKKYAQTYYLLKNIGEGLITVGSEIQVYFAPIFIDSSLSIPIMKKEIIF